MMHMLKKIGTYILNKQMASLTLNLQRKITFKNFLSSYPYDGYIFIIVFKYLYFQRIVHTYEYV